MIDCRTPQAGALRRRTVVIGCLLVAVAVAGCSSSKSKASSHSGVPTPVGTERASGVDKDAASAITTAYIRFFDPTVAEAVRLGLVQDGVAFSQAISEQSKSVFAKSASVRVTKVNVTSANRATVVYTVLLGGKPALPGTTGYAVLENGHWKVAGATFCELLALLGPAPPVCATAPATTMPS